MALAVSLGGAVEPLLRLRAPALHEAREPCRARGHGHPDELALAPARIGGKTARSVVVPPFRAGGVRIPIHGRGR